MERVKVHCRVKPFELQPEIDDDESSTFVTGSSSTIEDQCIRFQQSDGKVSFQAKSFQFDHVLEPDVSQEAVYQKVAFDIIQDVMEGYNGTIFAYGQTGSGKTTTMVGLNEQFEGEERGIIPRCLEDIFKRVEILSAKSEICVKISYVQIYCERILDLLSPETDSASLMIRNDTENGVYVQGATLAYVKNVQECMRCLATGNVNRTVASTNMNAQSSRSHAVFMVQVERKEIETATMTKQVKVSQLYMVDLAGSERVAKSMVRGTRFDELKSINLSLSALGNCVAALAQKRSHIPYRDSKLTRLLQYSLGGNAKTALIITVSAGSSESSETLSTLQFGQRCMKVSVQAHLNIQPDYKALYEAVQSHIDKRDDRINELEMQLQASRDENASLDEQLNAAQVSKENLEFELKLTKSQVNTGAPTGSDSGRTNPELQAKFDTEISTLRREHVEYLEKLKTRYDKQVAAYKTSSNTASQEWHNIEHELATERTGHLKTLQEFRNCREQLTKQEIESSDRIAQLLQEVEDAHKMTALIETEFKTHKESTHSKQKTEIELQEIEAKYKHLQQKMDKDYVSREQIDQMEKLYSDAIERLQGRVNSLETKKVLPPVGKDPKEELLKKSSSRLHKATAKVGRVQPARRTSNQLPRFR